MFSVVCSAAKMASASGSEAVQDRNAERRKRVLLGPLPGDFLQLNGNSTWNGLSSTSAQQEAADRQTALALQQQLAPELAPVPQGAMVGRLSVTLVQAKLVKNYGLYRMDPYIRLRVGHCVYESHTDANGGKNPRWNKLINCLLPPGVNTIFLEIYDECSFTTDALIAWAHISIPAPVMQGETHEDWYSLNGKQGDGMEGMINLILKYSTAPPTMVPYMSPYPPVMMVPNTMMGYAPMAVYPASMAGVQPRPPSPAQAARLESPPQLTEEELKTIEEMFPSIDKEVIKSVSEASRGDKDATVNSLLQMSE